jgi:uncharacterized repeat protein (TIGR01451 family)
VTLGIGLATALLAAPAVAAPTAAAASPTAKTASPRPLQLKIAVDDGRTSAASGDKLAYTVTVTNLGTTIVKSLQVTQSAPSGLKLASADPAGTSNAAGVVWTVDLKPAATATMHTSMTVTATPNALLRLATVACASLTAKGAPIVCATDSDQLPAGAAAAKEAAPKPKAAASSSGHGWWYVAGGGVLALGAAATLVARRRKRPAAV